MNSLYHENGKARPNTRFSSKNNFDEAADLRQFIATADADSETLAFAANLLRELTATTTPAPYAANPVIPFGKHKGATIKNVPAAYLRWMLTLPDLSSDLRGPVKALLSQYQCMKQPKGGRR